MRATLIATVIAVAALAALPQPAAARCANGYEAMRVQGKTPRLPLKAKQKPSRSETGPKHIPVESWSFGDGKRRSIELAPACS
jgi:hypothetical protein